MHWIVLFNFEVVQNVFCELFRLDLFIFFISVSELLLHVVVKQEVAVVVLTIAALHHLAVLNQLPSTKAVRIGVQDLLCVLLAVTAFFIRSFNPTLSRIG